MSDFITAFKMGIRAAKDLNKHQVEVDEEFTELARFMRYATNGELTVERHNSVASAAAAAVDIISGAAPGAQTRADGSLYVHSVVDPSKKIRVANWVQHTKGFTFVLQFERREIIARNKQELNNALKELLSSPVFGKAYLSLKNLILRDASSDNGAHSPESKTAIRTYKATAGIAKPAAKLMANKSVGKPAAASKSAVKTTAASKSAAKPAAAPKSVVKTTAASKSAAKPAATLKSAVKTTAASKLAAKPAAAPKSVVKTTAASKSAAKPAATLKSAVKTTAASKLAAKPAAASKSAVKTTAASKSAAKPAAASKSAVKTTTASKSAAKPTATSKSVAKPAAESKLKAKPASASKSEAKPDAALKSAAKPTAATRSAAKAFAPKPAAAKPKVMSPATPAVPVAAATPAVYSGEEEVGSGAIQNSPALSRKGADATDSSH
jgi:hypothetical protein